MVCMSCYLFKSIFGFLAIVVGHVAEVYDLNFRIKVWKNFLNCLISSCCSACTYSAPISAGQFMLGKYIFAR